MKSNSVLPRPSRMNANTARFHLPIDYRTCKPRRSGNAGRVGLLMTGNCSASWLKAEGTTAINRIPVDQLNSLKLELVNHMRHEVNNSISNSDDLIDSAGTLQAFAECAEEVAATTKKLQKAAILGAYLATLSDADLTRAARYFAGQQFALTDARTTNVGGSIISAALSEATGFSLEDLYPRYVRLGDPGELAAEIIKETKRTFQPTTTLVETESLVARLSETRGIKNKTRLLAAILHRASPLEAKYLVKLLAGDLRIGLREGLVEDAIARVFAQPLARVAQVNMLLGDIGETAVRARADDLEDV